jgi:hypothetical protein
MRKWNIFLILFSSLFATFLTSCSEENDGSTKESEGITNNSDSSQVDDVCSEILSQLSTLDKGSDIQVQQCNAESTSGGDVNFVLRLNDSAEWQQLMLSSTPEEIAFLIPLGLVAYGFGGSNVDPTIFNSIAVVFDDPIQTIYSFSGSQLANVLKAKDQEAATNLLLSLANEMTITGLR